VIRIAPALAALAIVLAFAASAGAETSTTDVSARGALAVLQLIPAQFDAADLTHDAATAGRLRALSANVASATASDPALRAAAGPAARLDRTLRRTRIRLQPWPLPERVRAESAAATGALRAGGASSGPVAEPYAPIDTLLSSASSALGDRDVATARLDAPAPTRCSRSDPRRG
jgi:hypothetical protein